jgi:ATP-dependent Clp protease ATP-binding subunit ClpA
VIAHEGGLARELVDATGGDALASIVDEALSRRIIGQRSAVESVVRTLRSWMALRALGWDESVRALRPDDDRRPLACILECGPTGVGKSETARILASTLFRDHLIALNGSDVGPEAPHGVSMWTGSPPGYVGSQDGGVLTDGLRRMPAALILIDEIEKAGFDAVQNILLPLLGDGIVVDRNTGESLSARQCVVVATSNIAIEGASSGGLGFASADGRNNGLGPREVFDALATQLRPETIGRFHAIVQFRALDRPTKREIWRARLRDIEARIGAGTRIVLRPDAERFVEQELGELATGARGVQDLFSRLVVPVVLGLRPGENAELGVRDGLLVVESSAPPLGASANSLTTASD